MFMQDYLTLDTPSDIYTMSDLNSAFNNTWINARSFMMNAFNLTEDEAITAITTVADFGVTQVVDGESLYTHVCSLSLPCISYPGPLSLPLMWPLPSSSLLLLKPADTNMLCKAAVGWYCYRWMCTESCTEACTCALHPNPSVARPTEAYLLS